MPAKKERRAVKSQDFIGLRHCGRLTEVACIKQGHVIWNTLIGKDRPLTKDDTKVLSEFGRTGKIPRGASAPAMRPPPYAVRFETLPNGWVRMVLLVAGTWILEKDFPTPTEALTANIAGLAIFLAKGDTDPLGLPGKEVAHAS